MSRRPLPINKIKFLETKYGGKRAVVNRADGQVLWLTSEDMVEFGVYIAKPDNVGRWIMLQADALEVQAFINAFRSGDLNYEVKSDALQ